MAAPNVQRIIWEYITETGTDLYSLIGTRAWHSGYPTTGADGVWQDGDAGIVFNVVSVTDTVNGQAEHDTIEFKCHGGDRTASSGQNVARALYERLHARGGRTTSGYIHRAWRIGQQDLTEPETGWRYTLSRYAVIIED